MLTIFFCICMFGIAEREKRSGWVWVLVTMAVSVSFQLVLFPGYWGAVCGLVSALALMTYMNIKHPVKKGPHLS